MTGSRPSTGNLCSLTTAVSPMNSGYRSSRRLMPSTYTPFQVNEVYAKLKTSNLKRFYSSYCYETFYVDLLDVNI